MNYPSHPHRRPAMPLVARAAHAATAAYQRAMTSKRERLYQQEIYRLRQENAWLRNEVRHCWDAIDGMGHDMEVRRQEFVLGELLARADTRRQTAVVDQRRLLEVHLPPPKPRKPSGPPTRRATPTGSCAAGPTAKTEFPYRSPTTNQAPSLEGA